MGSHLLWVIACGNYYLKFYPIITPLPFFQVKSKTVSFFQDLKQNYLFNFIFIYFILIFFSSLLARSVEKQQQNSKNTVQIQLQYVYIPMVFGMYALVFRVVRIMLRNTQNNVTIYLTTPSSSRKHSKHSIRHSKVTEYVVTNCILRCKYGQLVTM